MVRRRRQADVAVIGAGSATTALVDALQGDPSVVVFEPGLVGGECPYDACIPSKGLLHDGTVGRSWATAAQRRRELVHHRHDEQHVDALLDAGDVELVRERAAFVDEHRIASESVVVEADHVVIASGATPVIPDVEGLDEVTDRVWTSADALRATDAPERLVIAGAGVVGCEMSRLFASFGTQVTMLEPNEHLMDTLHPDVVVEIERVVRGPGVDLRLGSRPVSVARHGDGVAVCTADGSELRADRLLLAVGKRPRLDGLGIEALGLDPELSLPVDPTGRVRCSGSVWAIGDVAGGAQYTHAANHHGRVVADRITGSGTRRFDDVVEAACMFTERPMITVGVAHASTEDDPDVVWAVVDVAEVAPRASTDEQRGVLALAARRSSGRLVGAHGIGPSFDELVHAIVVAIDGDVPVERLAQSMYPFPTMGDAFVAALGGLRAQLAP